MSKINFNKIENTNILILLQTAEKLGIKSKMLDWKKYKISFSKNGKTHIITSKSLGINPSPAIAFTRDKSKTVNVLKKAGLPVLPQAIIKNLKDYQNQISFPQVIKPVSGQKGKNIYLNIKTKTQAEKIIKKLLEEVGPCIIEPYFKAQDYRFLALNNQVIGLSERRPPAITADGKHNLKQLIEIENQKRLDYNRKIGRRMLNRMLIWSRIKWYLNHQGLKFTDIPPKHKKIIVYPIPNFSTGGSVKTIPLTEIRPDFVKLAVQISKIIGLTIIGIDVLIKNIKKPASLSQGGPASLSQGGPASLSQGGPASLSQGGPASNNNCAIIEVNSDPGLRLHDWPNKGESQNVTEKILKYIFSY